MPLRAPDPSGLVGPAESLSTVVVPQGQSILVGEPSRAGPCQSRRGLARRRPPRGVSPTIAGRRECPGHGVHCLRLLPGEAIPSQDSITWHE